MSSNAEARELERLTNAVQRLETQVALMIARLPDPPELLSTHEILHTYPGRLSRATLWRLSDPRRKPRPLIRRVKVPGQGTRFPRRDIEAYLYGPDGGDRV